MVVGWARSQGGRGGAGGDCGGIRGPSGAIGGFGMPLVVCWFGGFLDAFGGLWVLSAGIWEHLDAFGGLWVLSAGIWAHFGVLGGFGGLWGLSGACGSIGVDMCVCFGELLAGFWGIGWFWDGLWPFECFGVVFGWFVSIRVLRCALGDLGRP